MVLALIVCQLVMLVGFIAAVIRANLYFQTNHRRHQAGLFRGMFIFAFGAGTAIWFLFISRVIGQAELQL